MKLIHCADIHLDSKMQSTLGKDKAAIRKRELLMAFERMVAYGAKHAVDGILIAGDLFDSKAVSKLCLNTVKKSIEENSNINFYYLSGNHDNDAFLSELTVIPDNLFTFGDTWSEYALGDSDGVRLFGANLNGDNVELLQNVFLPDPANVNIVMLHGQESVSAVKDKAAVIDLREFRSKGVNYLALGHIHAYKRAPLDTDGGIYCYSGCLEGRGFDEEGIHGFVMLDIDEDKHTVTDTFIPFDTRRVYVIEVDITGLNDSASMAALIRKKLENCDATDRDYVKVKLCGFVDVECEKDIQYISQNFEQDFFCFKLEDVSTFSIDVEKYAADVSLKGEFVRLCLADGQMDSEESARIIRTGLEAIMGGGLK